MINNSKNKRLKKLINSKILYTLPLAGIGIIGTQQTANAMFNPNGRPIPRPSTTYRTTLSIRITSNKTTSTSSRLSTSNLNSQTNLSNAPSNSEKIISPRYHYLHLGNDIDHNQPIGTKHTSSLTSRFLNPDLTKSTTSPTSTITTESSQVNSILNYKPKSKNYKMTITKITYMDDYSSTSSSQTKITKTESSSQSVSSLEERPSSPTSSTSTQSISSLSSEASGSPLPSMEIRELN